MISQLHDVESMDNRARLAPEGRGDEFQVGERASDGKENSATAGHCLSNARCRGAADCARVISYG
jgi:hypothetical protein